METQILKLEAPFDYIYCNGEVGKHIATYIVGESRIGEDGKYTLKTNITKEPSLCYIGFVNVDSDSAHYNPISGIRTHYSDFASSDIDSITYFMGSSAC